MTNDPMQPTQPEPLSPAAPVPAPVSAQPSPVPVPVTPVTKRKGSGAWINVALAIAVAIAIGGVAFAVGRSTAPTSASGQTGRGFGNGGLGGGFGNGGQFPTGSGAPDFGGQGGFPRGGRTINGTVESITAETMTIKVASGQTIEVTLGSATTYSTKAPATASDVTTGATVEVQLDFRAGGGLGNGQGNGGNGQGNGGQAAPGPFGTASNVTVVP